MKNDFYDNDFQPKIPERGTIACFIAFIVAVILAAIGFGIITLAYKLMT